MYALVFEPELRNERGRERKHRGERMEVRITAQTTSNNKQEDNQGGPCVEYS